MINQHNNILYDVNIHRSPTVCTNYNIIINLNWIQVSNNVNANVCCSSSLILCHWIITKSKVIMRQPIVKDLRSKTKVNDLTSKAKAKDFIKCPRGASRPRPWPRGLHHWHQLMYFWPCRFDYSLVSSRHIRSERKFGVYIYIYI